MLNFSPTSDFGCRARDFPLVLIAPARITQISNSFRFQSVLIQPVEFPPQSAFRDEENFFLVNFSFFEGSSDGKKVEFVLRGHRNVILIKTNEIKFKLIYKPFWLRQKPLRRRAQRGDSEICKIKLSFQLACSFVSLFSLFYRRLSFRPLLASTSEGILEAEAGLLPSSFLCFIDELINFFPSAPPKRNLISSTKRQGLASMLHG